MNRSDKADRSAIFSRLFGNNIARLRDFLSKSQPGSHINPNILTWLGMIVTLIGSFFLALGAGDRVGSSDTPGNSWFGLTAGLIIILANVFDILDGAVAKCNNRITKRGGFLDSSLDRISDGAIFTGIMIYYINHPEITCYRLWATLAVVVLINAELTSYVKARAENILDSCPVGYWQRGERIVAVLLGLFSGHMATVMILLAVSSAFTVGRRMLFAYRQIKRQETNQPLLTPYQLSNSWLRWMPWLYRRGTLPYDLATATNILLILLVDVQGMVN